MATSSHLDSLFAVQGIGSYGLARAGEREEQERWLPRVATGEVLASSTRTESGARRARLDRHDVVRG